MGVIVITGIQASGKSSVGQALAERLPRAVHLRGDAFRRMIVTGRAEMCDPPSTEALAQLRLRHELSAEAANRFASAGFTVVVQDVILGDQLAFLLERISARPLHLVVLAPTPDAVAARDHARQLERGKVAYRPGGHSVAALDAVLRRETPHRGLWLDTSTQTVDQTVEAILAGLDPARIG